MKRVWLASAVVLTTLASASGASAQGTSVALSGDPQPLSVRTAIAGLVPGPERDEGTIYSITVDGLSDLVAHLDAPLPPGVTLRVRLEPPPGAVGAGPVELTTAPGAVVRSIPPGTYSALGISYELSVSVESGVVPPASRQVIFDVVPAS